MRIIDDELRQGSGYPPNFIRFLGTAGTRFVFLTQRRASGGMWFSYGGATGVIDPGPGSLVRICEADPPLDVTDTDTMILTHRHIDHSCDANAIIEGMTLGHRYDKVGRLLITKDAVEPDDAVVLRYARSKVRKIKFHKDGRVRRMEGSMTVESVVHDHHGVQCFGIIARAEGLPEWGIISDTAAQPHFAERYKNCRMLVINTALPARKGNIDHMSVPDVRELLAKISPELVLLTHMGRGVLDLDRDELAASLSSDRTRVVPALDGMTVEIS